MQYINDLIVPKSQYDLYKENKSDKNILKLVQMSNRRFGSVMEDIVCKKYGMKKAKTSIYDVVDKHGKRIEVKAGRISLTGVYNFLHIEDRDYDHFIFVIIKYNDILFYTISKQELFDSGLLKRLGNQGFFCQYHKIQHLLLQI